ncbi:HAD family hydrolase [Candidatus Woesearchaeota archaeon]|nr:HAD family hydrolase [Candidatus Woesearchaeota archaeon]
MVTIAETKSADLVSEFAKYLRKIKSQYSLALITSAPEAAVEPILQKVGCSDLFDYVYTSPVNEQPSKKELLQEFIEKHGKPKFYIGHGDKDILSCKELGILSITVNWVSKGEHHGDYQADTVKNLEKLLFKLF